jgi:hypothetical protein
VGADLPLLLTEISTQLINEHTKIKIKARECLVKIISMHDLEQCKSILVKKLNKPYYDMLIENLKIKLAADHRKRKDNGETALHKYHKV